MTIYTLQMQTIAKKRIGAYFEQNKLRVRFLVWCRYNNNTVAMFEELLTVLMKIFYCTVLIELDPPLFIVSVSVNYLGFWNDQLQ